MSIKVLVIGQVLKKCVYVNNLNYNLNTYVSNLYYELINQHNLIKEATENHFSRVVL